MAVCTCGREETEYIIISHLQQTEAEIGLVPRMLADNFKDQIKTSASLE